MMDVKQEHIWEEDLKSYKGRSFGYEVFFSMRYFKKSLFYTKKKLVSEIFKGSLITIHFFPEELKKAAFAIWGYFRYSAPSSTYWEKDCSEMYFLVTTFAKEYLSEKNIPYDDDDLFRIFGFVIMQFSMDIVENKNREKEFRQFARKRIKENRI